MEKNKKVCCSLDEEPGSSVPQRNESECGDMPGSAQRVTRDTTISKQRVSGQVKDAPDNGFFETDSNTSAKDPRKADWRAEWKASITSVENLSEYLALSDQEKLDLRQVIRRFHMRITPHYFSLIREPQNPFDPIRMQCVPALQELCAESHEHIDPLGEEKTSPVPCLVHRYPDRALLLVTNKCFMYCRHCTRKRLWREKISEPTLKDIDLALSYVADNKQIREVIISGGDPLTLPTERLDYILSSVARRPNIEVVRIGTRAPVVLPSRIDDNLCTVLAKYQNLWINVQFNHPNEISAQAVQACRKLQACGIPINNQSVLLKDINDDAQVMAHLCHKLQAIRVRPYYMYQCDPVIGAWHFRTSVWRGIDIVEKMRGYTGGLCIPTYVIDGIDGHGKIPVGPNYLVSMSPEGVTLRNYKNETFFYFSPKE